MKLYREFSDNTLYRHFLKLNSKYNKLTNNANLYYMIEIY